MLLATWLCVAVALFWQYGVCESNQLLTICNGSSFPTQRAARFRFTQIARYPDQSIITDTFTENNRRKCTSVCAERGSLSLYFLKSTRICHCNMALDSNSGNVTGAPITSYGELEHMLITSGNGTVAKGYTDSPQRDCLQLFENGFHVDGEYVIYPVGGASVHTWCDMTNGGWTVFQRRQDGSENFRRNWDDYVAGFGDKCGEYWLGLENIHFLTQDPSELYVSLKTFGGALPNGSPTSGYARYSTFTVGGITDNYTLTAQGYTGNCGNSLSHHSGKMFSTFDRDNDESGSNCANSYKGGWWYGSCHSSNLNGLYHQGFHQSYADGVNWRHAWGYNYSLQETVMKFRRV